LWYILPGLSFLYSNFNITLRKKNRPKMYLNNKTYYSHVCHYLYFYLRMNLMKNSERKSLFNNVLKIPVIFNITIRLYSFVVRSMLLEVIFYFFRTRKPVCNQSVFISDKWSACCLLTAGIT